MYAGREQSSVFALGKVSEIARSALKELIAANRPAIPPYYEKAFYNKASEMGESELINEISSTLPIGQKATLMVEGVSTVISNLNLDIKNYRTGITKHGKLMEEKQDIVKQTSPPEVWNVLKKQLSDMNNANNRLQTQLEMAENRLQSQEQEVSKLLRETRKDPLTGAMNRLAMEEDLPNEYARNKRYNRTYSIIMSDIDHFKNVNDTYGHAIGDEILKAFVHILQRTLREVDVVYRFGGEEFLVLLPETDAEGALRVAERLREAVDSNVLTHRKNSSIKLRITSSFGVSINSDIDSSYLDIIERADKALYNAKNSGRNLVNSLFSEGSKTCNKNQ